MDTCFLKFESQVKARKEGNKSKHGFSFIRRWVEPIKVKYVGVTSFKLLKLSKWLVKLLLQNKSPKFCRRTWKRKSSSIYFWKKKSAWMAFLLFAFSFLRKNVSKVREKYQNDALWKMKNHQKLFLPGQKCFLWILFFYQNPYFFNEFFIADMRKFREWNFISPKTSFVTEGVEKVYLHISARIFKLYLLFIPFILTFISQIYLANYVQKLKKRERYCGCGVKFLAKTRLNTNR